jgi:hypothetical protein
MKTRWKILVIVAFGCASAAFAASPASAATSANGAAPAGYHLVTVKSDGFTIAVPDTWLAMNPKSKVFAAALKTVAAKNPRIRDALQAEVASMGSNTQFVAIDASGSDFSSNLSVSRLPVDKSALADLDALKTAFVQGLPKGAQSTVEARHTMVDGLSAAEVTARMNLVALSGQSAMVYAASYFVPSGSGVLQFAFGSSDPVAQDTTVQTMLASLRIAGAPGVLSAASAARYVSAVCSAVNTWDDKTGIDVSKQLEDLGSGRASSTSVRDRVERIYAGEAAATDHLLSSTKSLAPKPVSNVATKYVQNLERARDAYRRAQQDVAKAPKASSAALAKSLRAIDAKLTDATSNLGDPIETLNANSTLAHAVQSEASRAPVLDAWRPPTTSGLKVGVCATNDESEISCSEPHTDEVSLVTSYPAGPTAPWPGNDVMSAFADSTCSQAFTNYMGRSPQDSTRFNYGWFNPNSGSDWNSGDREVVCTVEMADQSKSTGSAKGVAG